MFARASSPLSPRDLEAGALQRPASTASTPQKSLRRRGEVPAYVRFDFADDFDALPPSSASSTPSGSAVPPRDSLSQPICPYAGNREKLKEWARRPELVRDISSPPVVPSPTPENTERWRIFAASTGFRPPAVLPRVSVSQAANFDQPWRGTPRPRPRGKRANPYLTNPWVVVVLRLAVLLFLLLGLVCAARLLRGLKRSREADDAQDCVTPASTYVTLILASSGVVYEIVFIVDFFLAGPIGWRSPLVTIALILADLFFIILNSVNLGFAGSMLSAPEWVCSDNGDPKCGVDVRLCGWQRALVGVLVGGELFLVWAFINSILKVVWRMEKRV